jgi:hypothetical protein
MESDGVLSCPFPEMKKDGHSSICLHLSYREIKKLSHRMEVPRF